MRYDIIAALPEKARRDALESLFILAGLRPLTPVIQREINQMPITVNLMENELFREAFEKVRREGLREGQAKGEYLMLSKLLENRFGPLPSEVIARLQTAPPETLERWGLALLTAATLEEVFRDG